MMVIGYSRKLHFVFACIFSAAAAVNAAYVQEDFRGTTAPGWVIESNSAGSPGLTAETGEDPDGDGWLRLTNDQDESQGAFAYYDTAIPTNQGLVFTFDFVTWGSGGTLADGLALAIFRADVDPDPQSYGGSLAYAPQYNSPGLNGAVAGFGFDEFGNFSNPTEGRTGGPGRTQNAVAIRGSQGEDRFTGYEYQTGTGPDPLPDFSTDEVSSRDDAVIHTVKITIPTDKVISVEWKPEGEDWSYLIRDYECGLNCPDQIKFGYAASTGSLKAYHEVRNLSVTAVPEPASISIMALGGLTLLRKRRK
ncbi:lectin-like domain-containing protein [Sedimentisphaera salicampi]|uniref:Ice-binding protein C-terminal domain-containing protein n=1 Tax=Sedimentisphaera salicampi TaxID=1941349 RepID=A0A1W6LMH5_9BACT|nr:PEP-CTERM sorting domain-containing protein [Sedimentisphaera salicampi]ARN56943.1 hypothetical protein STSP1_01336 [Sedimentisphaera salicampi]